MSIGLSYALTGMMQGRQQNIQDSLRRSQERRAQAAEGRAQETHGLNMRTGEANAIWAENRASEENLGRYNQTQQANADSATASATRAQRQASPEWMDTEYESIKAGLTGKQLGNTLTQQNITLNAEQLTPQNVARREQERKFRADDLIRKDQIGKIDLRIKQRNEELGKLTHLNDKTKAQQERQRLTDIDAYETIVRLRQGDKLSAIRLFNELDSNGIYDATDLAIDEEGNLHIKRQSGEDLIYPAEDIKAIEGRVQAEIAKTKKDQAPKVYTEKVFSETGAEIGERAYTIYQDPATGRTYKQYIDEMPETPASDEERRDTALDLLVNKEITLEEFKRLTGSEPPSKKPTTTQASQPAGNSGEFDEGEILPLPSATITNSNQPKPKPQAAGFGLNRLNTL
mgnify:CR=1 FL=1